MRVTEKRQNMERQIREPKHNLGTQLRSMEKAVPTESDRHWQEAALQQEHLRVRTKAVQCFPGAQHHYKALTSANTWNLLVNTSREHYHYSHFRDD